MNDGPLFWSAFFQGVGAGLLIAVIVAAIAVILLLLIGVLKSPDVVTDKIEIGQ